MPGAADWQNLPNSVTQAWDQSQQADDWALEQQSQTAQDWGDAQRAIPTPSDSLTNPLGTGNGPVMPAPAAGAAPGPPTPGAAAAPPPAAPVAPAASTSPTPDATATPAPTNGQFSPYDDTFKKYAGDLANDPEFIKIVAAGTLAESSWNTNSTSGDGGHSWGLFQMHDRGMGAGMGNSRLDPDAASAVMVPRYADAYRKFTAQGLQGPALAAAVGHAAEMNADASGSGYAAAYKTLSNGNAPTVNASVPQNFLSGAGDFLSNVGSAAQGAVGAAGSAAQSAGAALQDAGGRAVNALTTPGGIQSAVATSLEDTAQNPPYSPLVPGQVQSAVLNAGAAFLRQPGVLDNMQTMFQLGQRDPSTLTDTEQAQLRSARLAVVGATLGGGGENGGVNPGGRPLFGRGGVPGADVGRTPVPAGTNPDDLEEKLAQSALQVVVKQARDAGMSDDDIAAVFRKAGGTDEQISNILHPVSDAEPIVASPTTANPPSDTQPVTPTPQADQPPPVQFDANGNAVNAEVPGPTGPMQNVTPQGTLAEGVQNIPGRAGGAEPPTMARNERPGMIISANGGAPDDLSPQSLPDVHGVTPDGMQAAYQRIDQRIQDPQQADAAKAQLDQLVQAGDPAAVARFLTVDVEGNSPGALDVLRTERTGSMAGSITSLGKVALSPVIQTAMRAPVGALKLIVQGRAGDIPGGLAGGLAGLADGAQDALQTARYGINMKTALAGTTAVPGGGYGFAPGLDVLGSNPLQRAAGTALSGLVRLHGAAADISAGIGSGANAALGASPEQAAEAGQQWALRSGQYGFVGQKVADALEGLKGTNPALNVVGQILVPFYRVGYNAFTQGVERSPLGLGGRVTDALQGKPLDTGKLMNNMFGVGLAAGAFAEASQGNITGANPQNGAPQWSVRVPEQSNLGPLESLAKRDTQGNLWIPLRDLGPAGESLSQAAALYEAARDGNGDVADVAGKTAYNYVSHVMDTTWLSTLNDLMIGWNRRSVVGDVKDLASSRSPITRASAQRNLQSQGKFEGQSFIPQSALAGQVGKMAGQPDLSSLFLNQAAPQQTSTPTPPAPQPVRSGGRSNPWATSP